MGGLRVNSQDTTVHRWAYVVTDCTSDATAFIKSDTEKNWSYIKAFLCTTML